MTDYDDLSEDEQRELERLQEAYAADALDSAAILAMRPATRAVLRRLSSEDRAVLIEILLGWIDELFLDPANDIFRTVIETRAEVALATTPTGLAELNK